VELAPLVLSLKVATIATVIAAVIGIAIAAFLANARFFGRDLVDVLVTAPVVLPPTVLGYYLLVAIGRRSAVGHAFETAFGTSIVFTQTGAVVAATVGAMPLVVKSSRAAIEQVEPALIRAARTLGAAPVRTFLTVQCQLASRGITAAVMLAFARALGDFGVTLMVAGDIPGETQTASLAIYDSIQGHHDNAALGLVIALAIVAMTILYISNKLVRIRHVR